MFKEININQEQIKEINRVKIINIIREYKEITKQEITNQLGLSIPTVTTNINTLIHEGLVVEAGVAKSTGGRKPVVLQFVKNARYAIGVNIAYDKVTILLINLNGEEIDEEAFDYLESYSFDKVLELLIITVDKLLKKNNINKSIVIGTGIALPGLVNDETLFLGNAPNIGVRDYNFNAFQEKIGIKTYIENEANIAAFAELMAGKAKNKGNLVYISVNEGIGTGIIIQNHIYKSSQKKAGEFGHIRISDEDLQCNCGRKGCWELYASKNALIKYFKEYSNQTNVTLDMVFDRYKNNDADAIKALKKYIKYLFRGIENIILGLNPDYVILGGELGNYENEIMQLMNEVGEPKNKYVEYEGSKILFSDFKNQGALIGAALLPLEQIFNYEKNII